MDGTRIAQQITKKYAKTFYFASLFLKKDKREASYAVYAACRLSDETVDGSKGANAQVQLNKLEQKLNSVYSPAALDDPVLSALRAVVGKYQISKEYFDALLAGMRMDLDKARYADFAELRDYCYKVAGVVGLVMLRIFGWRTEAADFAVDMGIAMQLTNILRDIREDFRLGRIYLPADELRRFGVSESDIAEEKITDNFCALMRFEIERARQYYVRASAGIKLLADPNSRFVARAMSDIYSGILTEIERNGYDVYTCRAHVGLAGKVHAILMIL
jgi:15-cis-phytoene synthase